MTQTWFLFRHLMKTDLRESHGIASLILFAIATVYAVYLVVQGRPDPSTWNAMAWVILLFTACVIGGVSFCLYVKFWPRKPFKYQVFADETLDKEIEMGDLADT